jgi:RimJ/RimL family protein N-acetyltransferase
MTQPLSTAKGNITIRMATTEDAAGLFKLRLEAIATHPTAFAADIEMTRVRGLQAWVEQINNDSKAETGVIMTASAREALIGMSGVGRGHWPKTGHSAIVWGVYVSPEWRGMHIAAAMLGEGIQWARDHEIVVLKLGVVTTNEAAIRCYLNSGFTVYGLEPKALKVNDTYYDEYLMARMI